MLSACLQSSTPFPHAVSPCVPFVCRAPSGGLSQTDRIDEEKPKPTKCKPYCLFNVVEDHSESVDLASNVSYAGVIKKNLDRLAANAAIGPDTSLAYPFSRPEAAEMAKTMCANALGSGFAEPHDISIPPAGGGSWVSEGW